MDVVASDGQRYSFVLTCHPATPCRAVQSVNARLQDAGGGALAVGFLLQGDLNRLRVPPPARPRRADRLWTHTCFEVFVGLQGQSAYYEFNLSPSGEWAAYAFRRYRDPAPIDATRLAPAIQAKLTDTTLTLNTTLSVNNLPLITPHAPLMIGISAVIEDDNGVLSYWALKHPPGKPDFHHADAFALALPPAQAWPLR